MVSRTARLWTSGMRMTPRRLASRNPIAKYIAGSIMRDTLTQTKQNTMCRENRNGSKAAFRMTAGTGFFQLPGG